MARKNNTGQDAPEDAADLEELKGKEEIKTRGEVNFKEEAKARANGTETQGIPQGGTDERQGERQGERQDERQDENAPETPEAPDPPQPDPAQPDPAQPDPDEPLSLSVLAAEYRTASWEHAAMLRLMGWADGKQVSRKQYENAKDALANRRQGGGRR